jgi:hypothetical protein
MHRNDRHCRTDKFTPTPDAEPITDPGQHGLHPEPGQSHPLHAYASTDTNADATAAQSASKYAHPAGHWARRRTE